MVEEHNHPNEAISILAEKSISQMEEMSIENPGMKVPEIRRQVEEELFNSFADSDNFHILLKEELGSAENIDKRINRFRKRKIASILSEKVPMEFSSERNGPEDIDLKKRRVTGKTGQGKNLSKDHLSKREENIATNSAPDEDFKSELAFNSLRLANSKRVASNYSDLYTILWRLNLTHLSSSFDKELIDFDILKITTALELRNVLRIPFGQAKKIKIEVEKMQNETAISDYFEAWQSNGPEGEKEQ